MIDPTRAIAERLKAEREVRGWSIAELAQRSGISKAMISKVERGQASPTASLLGRFSGAFGLSLSALLARAEQAGERLARAAEQPVWRDPETGYIRRALSPPAGGPLGLTQVVLPAGARVPFPASAYAFLHHQIWLIAGRLTFIEGATEHHLETGDCLQLGAPVDCVYYNPGDAPAVYLVAVVRR
jgi:transcriptional regulator with XRE-family HTH domain